MAEVINRDDVVWISRKLDDCKKNLQNSNIYSCISCFKQVLEKIGTTPMLPSDTREIVKEINGFQMQLSLSKSFRDVYGPVTFRDNEFDTTLDFMNQLIILKEEEARELFSQLDDDFRQFVSASPQKNTQEAFLALEKGDFSSAQEIIGEDEELCSRLVDLYNSMGIKSRKDGDYDRAITHVKKAISIQPQDEHLYYNLARIHIERSDWEEANIAVDMALSIDPDFEAGKKLKNYIAGKGTSNS
ncbi:MAG: tetratricopeptide repeat protein [Syntrophobacterales bacterium]|jgi:tetratricopeptide (TPR) repeat protein|nr:tetratricopeptide repeat protein [Syntrophobacterales bacterium]